MKGGHLVQPGDKEKARESSTPGQAKPQLASVVANPDDDDNPFRPPADLRAEDESARKKRKVSTAEDTAASPTPSSAAMKTTTEEKSQPEAPKSKISFSIKGRASAIAAEKALPTAPKPQTSPEPPKKTPVAVSPLVQNNVPKSRMYIGNTRIGPPKSDPPTVKKETVKKKRLKPRPQLSEEFAQSESVYFRKTGNESVVGSGTYGKVYKAVHVYTGGMVALKKIRMEGERDGVSSINLRTFTSKC